VSNSTLEHIDNPFMDLPPERRPTASPFDMRLMFNTLSGDLHRPFMQLMREIQFWHMNSYNKPELATDPEGKLYSLATSAGLDTIAMEMARNWGVKDPDGHIRAPGCEKLLCWPGIEERAPHTVQMRLTRRKPHSVLWGITLGGGDSLSLHENGHTVMSHEGKVMKPGDWIGGLLVEYARYRHWREEFGEHARHAPKPAHTLPAGSTGLNPT